MPPNASARKPSSMARDSALADASAAALGLLLDCAGLQLGLAGLPKHGHRFALDVVKGSAGLAQLLIGDFADFGR